MGKLLQESGEALLLENGSFILLEDFALTIADTDFLPYYQTNSMTIRELVQNKSSVMNLNIIAQGSVTVPREGSEIIAKHNERFLFGGFITRVTPTEIGKGQMFIYAVEASDYSFIFGSKIARRAFSNTTLRDIVLALMDDYLDDAYGFDMTNVETGPMIPSIVFDHISVRKCFEKLSKLTGYVWYVDYQKNLFFTSKISSPAPEGINDVDANHTALSIAYDSSQLRNSVIVIGSETGEASGSPTTQSFVGDGETRIWLMDDKPASVASIKLNGVSKQFHEAAEEQESDYFIYDQSTGYFYVNTASPTPGIGETIEIAYNPYIPIIVQQTDPVSIDFFANLDGGDGIYEYTIKDPSIASKAEAQQRAVEELAEFSMPLVKGQFTTRSGLLLPGSIFTPGQVITVNLPSYGISTDTTFLVQEVNISMIQDSLNDTTEYEYRVRFGGRLTGVMEFLESLATEDDANALDDAQILTIEQITDVFAFADSAPTRTYFTPPFEYGAGGNPQGRWNLSEWS